MHEEKPECTCRDFEFRDTKCKHIFAVEYTIQREQTADGATITTETVKVTPSNAAICQSCPLTIQCFATWKRKPSRLTCTN